MENSGAMYSCETSEFTGDDSIGFHWQVGGPASQDMSAAKGQRTDASGPAMRSVLIYFCPVLC